MIKINLILYIENKYDFSQYNSLIMLLVISRAYLVILTYYFVPI